MCNAAVWGGGGGGISILAVAARCTLPAGCRRGMPSSCVSVCVCVCARESVSERKAVLVLVILKAQGSKASKVQGCKMF